MKFYLMKKNEPNMMPMVTPTAVAEDQAKALVVFLGQIFNKPQVTRREALNLIWVICLVMFLAEDVVVNREDVIFQSI